MSVDTNTTSLLDELFKSTLFVHPCAEGCILNLLTVRMIPYG